MTERDVIHTCIKTRGLTQKVVAEMMGYRSHSAIGQGLSQKSSMTVETVLKYLNALGFELVIQDKDHTNTDNCWKIDYD